jgi:hypothetical protein
LTLTFAAPPAAFAQGSGAGTVVPGVTIVAPKTPEPGPPPAPTPEQRAFVRSHAAPSRIGQLTRWNQSVCPTTVGLSPAMNDFVSARVKAVAAEISAPHGPCKSNIVIVFTSKPQLLLDAVRKKAPVLLGFHYPSQVKRLATVRHPIQAWYVTATSSEASGGGLGGLGTGRLSGPVGAAAENGPGLSLDDGDSNMPSGCAGGHFTDCLSNQIVAEIIVADRDQVAGQTIGSIADYIAMLALSKVDLDQDCADLDSITNLMAAHCPAGANQPEALTRADIAYLKALYSINMGRVLWVQRDSVADIMAKVMAER